MYSPEQYNQNQTKSLNLLNRNDIINFQDPSQADGGNYIVRAVNEIGDKDCTLALNFGK